LASAPQAGTDVIVNVSAYLERINYGGSTEATANTLAALHRAHLYAVPFENLDIHLGRPIVLDEDRLFDKIVRQRRGGFCYELNACFAALLRAMGFEVYMMSARVWGENKAPGPEFDHMNLRVELEATWLADVGFGEAFLQPMPLRNGAEREDQGTHYRLNYDDQAGRWSLRSRELGVPSWVTRYDFTVRGHALHEFAAQCIHTQTSPQSLFTQKRICTRPSADGRITLSDLRLITTRDGVRSERELAGEEEYRALLREHFGIALPKTKRAG
jgi:N-hydroxyarylamine O-acetyltransferase